MGGRLVHIDDYEEIGPFAEEYGMDISEEFSFCPIDESELLAMPQCLINHSCAPNAGFADQSRMVAIADIDVGEEVVYDYAFVWYSTNPAIPTFTISCECGAKTCRGSVGQNDWKRPELHARYGRWFQPFLIEKFEQLSSAKAQLLENAAAPTQSL